MNFTINKAVAPNTGSQVTNPDGSISYCDNYSSAWRKVAAAIKAIGNGTYIVTTQLAGQVTPTKTYTANVKYLTKGCELVAPDGTTEACNGMGGTDNGLNAAINVISRFAENNDGVYTITTTN